MDYLNILQCIDKEEDGFEYPKDFNSEVVEKMYDHVYRDIKKCFYVDCVDFAEDASLYVDIYLKKSAKESDYCCVKLSNFGNLALISFEERVSREDIEIITSILNQCGYIVIPSAIVMSPYSGKHPKKWFETWYDRFFNYT